MSKMELSAPAHHRSQGGPVFRCNIPWPGGAKCAVALAWDIDIDTTLHLERPVEGFAQYEVLSSLRYEDVGIRNVVAALEDLGLKQTFFVCGWCIERYPEVCGAIRDGGHEIAHHGCLHEPPNQQSAEQELHWLRRGSSIIRDFTGRAPRGWRAPYAAFSPNSPACLVQEGFLYDSSLTSDHNPFLIQTDRGSVLELPIDITMSDAPHYSHVPSMNYTMSPKTPQQAIDYYMSMVEATHKIGGFLTSVWHPEISARPARLLAWVDMLRALQARGDIWLAPLEEVARHVRSCLETGSADLRTVDLPYYREPIPKPQ